MDYGLIFSNILQPSRLIEFQAKGSFVDYSYLRLKNEIKWCNDVSSWVFLYLCPKVVLN